MAKPTAKRIGVLRYVRDSADEAQGLPAYTGFMAVDWRRLSRYGLWEEDGRIVRSAQAAGLIRFSKDDPSFSFLTEQGKALLEKHKDLYPEIPAPYGKTPGQMKGEAPPTEREIER